MPYERKLRQSSKTVFLADLEAGDAIEVTCATCRHWTLIAPHVLLARSPASVTLAAALLHLRDEPPGEQGADDLLGGGDPVWRETGDGHGATLVATEAGLEALGLEAHHGPTAESTAPAAPDESFGARGAPGAASESANAVGGQDPRRDEAGATDRDAYADGRRDHL